MRGPDAPVTPSVLKWARETAGLDLAASAKRISVSSDRLSAAEAGTGHLTLNQARALADVYERPFALLFLPAPPEEADLEVQFRRLRDAPSLPWPPAMRALARRIPALQQDADELLTLLDEEPAWPERFEGLADASLDEAIEAIRDAVGVRLDEQKQAARLDPKGYRAFRIWREALEELAVLVIQDGGLSVEEMRGFVSPHERVPAIVLNTGDDVRARLFTLIHELAHLVRPSTTEDESDRLAAAVLMPERDFGRDFRSSAGRTLLEKVDSVALLYSVTSDAASVRVGWLNLAPWDDVNDVRAAIRRRGGPRSPGGGNYYRNVVTRLGPGFTSRVLNAVDQGLMSDLAAARVLGTRIAALDGLRNELGANAA